MDRLRRMTPGRRFGLVLAGTIVGNNGHTRFEPPTSSLLLPFGAALCLIALGAFELAAHLWRVARRPSIGTPGTR